MAKKQGYTPGSKTTTTSSSGKSSTYSPGSKPTSGRSTPSSAAAPTPPSSSGGGGSSNSGGGGDKPRSSASQPAAAPAFERPPEPAKRIFAPLVDARRSGDSGRVDRGDILPNIREAFSRPNTRIEDRKLFSNMDEQEAEEKRQELREQQQEGTFGEKVKATLELAQRSSPVARTVQTGVAGLGNLISLSGEMTEKALGTAGAVTTNTQVADPRTLSAFNPLTAPFMLQNAAVKPLMHRTAINLLNQMGMTDQAQQMQEQGVNPTVYADILANAVVDVENVKPGEARVLRGLLDAFTKGTNTTSEDLLNRTRAFKEQGGVDLLGDKERLQNTYDAATYAYEGLDKFLEAQTRLNAGESWDDVTADIEDKLTFRERMRDLQGQLLYDPLNAFDWGLKIGALGGGNAGHTADLAETFIQRTTLEVPVERASQIASDFGDIAKADIEDISPTMRFLTRYVPGFRRTDKARVARFAENATETVRTVLDKVSGNERRIARELAEAGVEGVHPKMLAVELLMNPTADNIADTGKSADELAELMGFRYLDEQGRQVNIINSESAAYTREIFRRMDNPQKYVDQFSEIRNAYRELGEARLAKKGLFGRKRREAMTEVYEAAHNKFGDLLDQMDKDIVRALGIEEPTGTLAKGKEILDNIQGFHATYFHMGFTPAWANRNFVQNTVSMLMDGINNFTPRTSVMDEMDRYEMAIGSIREAGQQADNLALKKGPFGIDFEKIPFFQFKRGRRIEEFSGNRIQLDGMRRVFQQQWDIGGAIPEESYELLRSNVGDELAQAVWGELKQARNMGEIDSIMARMSSGDSWRFLPPELAGKLEEAGVAGDVRKLLAETPSWDELPERIDILRQEWAESLLKKAEELAPASGQPENVDLMMLENYLQDIGAPTKTATSALTQRGQEINLLQIRRTLFENYTNRALRDAAQSGADPAQLAKLSDQFDKIRMQQSITEQKLLQQGTDFRAIMFSRSLTEEQKLAGLRNLGFIGPDTVSLNHGWERYFAYMRTKWGEVGERAQRLYGEIGDAAYTAAGKPPSLRPDDAVIQDLLTYNDFQATDRWDRLVRKGIETGVIDNGIHLTEILKNAGVLPDDVRAIRKVDINNNVTYRRMVDALLEHADAKGVDGAAEWYEQATRVGGKGQGGDFLDALQEMVQDQAAKPRTQIPHTHPLYNEALRYSDAEGLFNDVWAFVAKEGPQARQFADLSDEAGDVRRAVDNFLSIGRERLPDVQTVARQTGDALRDQVLFNYKDRRKFDTALGVVFNYPFWHTRNAASYIRRAYHSPGAVASLFKLNAALERQNRGLPEWWRGQLSLNVMGEQYYLPIQSLLNPLNGYFGDKFRDTDQRQTPVGQMVNEMQQFGPGAHAWLTWAMMLNAAARGEKDEALSWINYVGQPTRAYQASTVLLRQAAKQVGADWVAEDVIPAGGSALEPWLYTDYLTEDRQLLGSKYDARRISKALTQMVEDGEITLAMASEAEFTRSGPYWERAKEIASEKNAFWTLAGWLIGAGIKARPESDIQIAEMDARMADMYANRDSMTTEEWRQSWQDMREEYPWMDVVSMSRRDDDRRTEMYIWNVYNRLPPNGSEYIEAVSPGNGDLWDRFWAADRFSDLEPEEQDDLLQAMVRLGAVLEVPVDEYGQINTGEWTAARNAYTGMRETLAAKYPEDVALIEQDYWNIMDTQGYEAARTYGEQHPVLYDYWEEKNQMILQDELLSSYYGTIDTAERYIKAQLRSEYEDRYPTLFDDQNEYFTLKAQDPDLAAEFLANHPHVIEWWDAQDVATVRLREELEGYQDYFMALNPVLPQMREDARVVTPGQVRVAELLEANGQMLGRWELPDDLSDRELKAALDVEKNSIPEGQFGTMYRELREVGLDRMFTAYLELGDVETIAAGNQVEFRALLVAMSEIREANGWAADGDTAKEIARIAGRDPVEYALREQVIASGSGGGTSNRSSRRSYRGGGGRRRGGGGGGGSSSTRPNPEQQASQINDYLVNLRRDTPELYRQLRSFASMTAEQQATFLEQFPHLAEWLRALMAQGWLHLIAQYLNSGNTPTSTSSRSSGSRGPQASSTRVSIPGL